MLAAAIAAVPAAGASAAVVQRAVSFQVTNVNRSAVSCPADGKSYEVRGHLVYPRSAGAAMPRSVTLYLHGLGYGEYFWRFDAVPGYDYATAQARAGHASVVIDRLGYDASGHPPGMKSCVGAQADAAHQIVGQLRSGDYRVKRSRPVAFKRVALAGHSIGGQIAQIEAYSFHDVDALLVVAYADQSSPTAITEFVKTGVVCAGGGQPAEPGAPGGYAYFGQSAADFQAAMFHNADPAVVAAATAMRNRDPCGDTSSVPQALIADRLGLSTIAVPVLVVCAQNDALFPPSGCSQQKGLFSGSDDVSDTMLPDTGHAVTLERSRGALLTKVSDWLSARGF